MHPVRHAALQCHDHVVGLRRELHQAPELSYRERATAALVKRELDAMGIAWQAVGEHGVVATIVGRHENAMVALRADMDALPIQEKNEHLAYRSATPGVMHACGHDGHVAMLLAAARILMQFRAELNGAVKLCFQQAEEQGGGTPSCWSIWPHSRYAARSRSTCGRRSRAAGSAHRPARAWRPATTSRS